MPWPKGRPRSKETREKISKASPRLSGKDNPSWKGGRVLDSNGYVLVKSPNHPFRTAEGYVREHRLVVEAALELFLTPDVHVHHINGDKTDNRLSNLQVTSAVDHQATHHVGAKRKPATKRRISDAAKVRWSTRRQVGVCSECKIEYPLRKRGKTFCSVACATASRKRRGWHPPGVGAKISATKKKRQS